MSDVRVYSPCSSSSIPQLTVTSPASAVQRLLPGKRWQQWSPHRDDLQRHRKSQPISDKIFDTGFTGIQEVKLTGLPSGAGAVRVCDVLDSHTLFILSSTKQRSLPSCGYCHH